MNQERQNLKYKRVVSNNKNGYISYLNTNYRQIRNTYFSGYQYRYMTDHYIQAVINEYGGYVKFRNYFEENIGVKRFIDVIEYCLDNNQSDDFIIYLNNPELPIPEKIKVEDEWYRKIINFIIA